MIHRGHRVSAFRIGAAAVIAAALVAGGTACRTPGGAAQSAQASDEWTRSYPLDAGGEVQVVNTSGSVELEAGSGTSVAVRAERVAHATTDQGARDLLAHIQIRDTAAPDHVTIETERISGVLIGASFDVHYHVTVPASAAVRVRNANGNVRATALGAKTVLNTTNGNIVGRGISGNVEARTTNGGIDLETVAGSADFMDLRSVNGRIDLSIPKTLNANLSATSVNGRVQVTDLPFESFGDPVRDTRRVRGRINNGGASIELNATNGSIHVSGHE